MNHHSKNLFEYCQALQLHDWSFEYSDDHSVWQRGRASLGALQEMQPKVDPDFTVWNKFAPTDYRRQVESRGPAEGPKWLEHDWRGQQ